MLRQILAFACAVIIFVIVFVITLMVIAGLGGFGSLEVVAAFVAAVAVAVGLSQRMAAWLSRYKKPAA